MNNLKKFSHLAINLLDLTYFFFVLDSDTAGSISLYSLDHFLVYFYIRVKEH